MLLEKLCCIKTNINFRDPGTDPLAKCWVQDFLSAHEHHAQNFIEGSSNLKHLKNVKSINNTTSSYPVSCRVIPRPATLKE